MKKISPIKVKVTFEKYLAGTASLEDKELLYEYLGVDEGTDKLEFLIETHFKKEETISNALQEQAQNIADTTWPIILARLEPKAKIYQFSNFYKYWIKYAAVFIFCTLLGYGLVHYYKRDMRPLGAYVPAEIDIQPGSHRAKLKIGDSQELTLNEDKNSLISKGDSILYADGTEIQTVNGLQMITLTTPNGGEYAATLSDGTKVWLNAGSEIIYPTKFGTDQREVHVKGEVYFEVVKDKKRPFIVHSAQQRIEVLGTSFNINAYPNESTTKTTLLTGSVRVSLRDNQKSKSKILSPGHQSVIGNDNGISIHTVDAKAAMAWKNGYFNFHELSIDESLKQIERWYDIKVIYKGKKPNGFLGGKMSRGVQLSSFLSFIEEDFQLKAELKADRTLVLYDIN